jgi:hypothetical protein
MKNRMIARGLKGNNRQEVVSMVNAFLLLVVIEGAMLVPPVRTPEQAK